MATRPRAATKSSTRKGRLRGLVNPVPDSEYGRVDQGVDYLSRAPVRAIASGRIESHDQGMAGGTGDIIRERLDKPISVAGRTYQGVYYSERAPLVDVGATVRAGEPVMEPGSNEIGFLVGDQLDLPPLIGGLGAGTQPTQPGQDFAALVGDLGGPRVRGGGTVTVTAGPPRDHGSQHNDSTGSSLEGDVGALVGFAGQPLVDTWHLGASSGFSFLNIFGDSAQFLKAAVWLIDPRNWLRLFEIVTGGILMLLGFLGLGVLFAARSDTVQEAAGVAALAPGSVGAAGRLLGATRAARSPQARRRIAADRVPQQVAERAATQQGEREERQSQRRAALAAARASGRRRAQAASTRQRADERFGGVPF